VDVGSKAQIYEAIAEMAASGKSVLVVSSYLPELFGICDRLAVMVRGVPVRGAPGWRMDSGVRAGSCDWLVCGSQGEASLKA